MIKNYKTNLVWLLFICLISNLTAQEKLINSKYGLIISNYLKTDKSTSKFTNIELDDIFVNKTIISQKTGIVNVYLNQSFQGIKIYNAVSIVGIKNDKIFHFVNKLETLSSKNINTTTANLSAEDAVLKLANHFKLEAGGNLKVISQLNDKTVFSNGNISSENISVEKVYFKDNNGVYKLSWDLSIYTPDGAHWWSARIDATSGAILELNDWILNCTFEDSRHSQHNHFSNSEVNKGVNLFKEQSPFLLDGAKYRVYALPAESPNHGSRVLITEPANSIASPFGWHDDNGIVGPEYTSTQGNNVIAKEDIDANDIDGNMSDGGSSLNFDFPVDFQKQPDESLDASLTNLFYWNNVIHDITYFYGFDEASGNFQETHYIRENKLGQKDPVIAEGLDGGGFNNANFGTPPDGSKPRMQMYLWQKANGIALKINNGSLLGSYVGIPAAFGANLKNNPLTGELVLITDDDSGASTDPHDACDPITNAPNLAGKIAVINRGGCEFGSKLLAAQSAGAIGAIVINSATGTLTTMSAGANGASVTIPGIMISKTNGDAIIAALNNFEIINATLQAPLLIDGNYDNGVVVHEYGHGISNRLTGGATNTNCLTPCTERDEKGACLPATNTEQMGEGWSDWFALMLTMKSTDTGDTGRGIGTYGSDQPISGPGIRPYRYSTNRSINPTTYADTNNTNTFSAPHGVGSIWCAMLWDLTWAYINKYGFDSNFYTGTGGNNKVMQIIMDGLKLQPCNPGFVDGRDAILAADMALTGGADQCMIWEVFASRGLGINASQGSSLLRTDQVANFEMPATNSPSLANCTTLKSIEYNRNSYSIYPNPSSSNFIIKTPKNMGDVKMDLYDINGRKVMSKFITLSGEVLLNAIGLQRGIYILHIEGEFINTTEKLIVN